MDLKINGRNMEINEQIRNHVSQKLGQVHRHLPGIIMAKVELASEPTRSQKDRIVAQVTLDVGNAILRAEQRAPNTTAAINAVAEALDRRIDRYKSQTYRSERARQNTPDKREAGAEESLYFDAADSESPVGGALVRVKKFDMKPMTVEDAATQMQLLGHDFFMFLNSEPDQYNILYLRDDGNYGLIQPKDV